MPCSKRHYPSARQLLQDRLWNQNWCPWPPPKAIHTGWMGPFLPESCGNSSDISPESGAWPLRSNRGLLARSTLQPALLLMLAEQQHISRSGCGLGQARRAQWAENRTHMLFYGLQSTPWSSLTCNEGMAHAPSRLLSSRAADPRWYRGLGFCGSPARHMLRYIEPEGTKTWLRAAHSYSGGLLIRRSRTDEQAHLKSLTQP